MHASFKSIVLMSNGHKYLAWKFNSIFFTQSKPCPETIVGTNNRNLLTFRKTFDTFSMLLRQKHEWGTSRLVGLPCRRPCS